jgi:lysozyme family protein
MPAPTPQQTELGYHRMWDASHVNANKVASAKAIAARIKQHQAAYERIERATGVPWPMVGGLHSRESDLNFKTHLHNGDSLNARTRHVPAGRPVKGNPPFEFEASAIDALTMSPHKLNRVTAWSCERILYESEKYNGWGYLKRGNSPYVWSWTDLYHGGKFVSNGVYRSDVWDSQAGVVAIFKELIAIDPSVAHYFVHRDAKPPEEVNEQATKRERVARTAGGAGALGGGGSEGAKQSQELVEGTGAPPVEGVYLPSSVALSLLGVGIAVVLIATFLIARKKTAIATKWLGAPDTRGPGALIPPPDAPPDLPAPGTSTEAGPGASAAPPAALPSSSN